jgi:phosphatidylinositol-3-phosphatase
VLPVVVLLVVVLLVGLAAPGGRPPPTRASAPRPCGRRALSETRYSHVIWIWMENHGYGEIIGSPEAPYINALAAQCGLATNYHNIGHPSLPNYIAATSGLPPTRLRRFRSDCNPSPRCTTPAQSLFGQLPSWKAYEESMPGRCDRQDEGDYAVRHNPPAYYPALGGCARDDVGFGHLARDLARRTLAAFSFITPNLVHDMHDGTIAQGDRWLATTLPQILDSSEYRGATTVVVITWDEGAGGAARGCAADTREAGCHVATIVLSPSTQPGTRSAELFTHYSLLGSTERLLGLPSLGAAGAAGSMITAFDL